MENKDEGRRLNFPNTRSLKSGIRINPTHHNHIHFVIMPMLLSGKKFGNNFPMMKI